MKKTVVCRERTREPKEIHSPGRLDRCYMQKRKDNMFVMQAYEQHTHGIKIIYIYTHTSYI